MTRPSRVALRTAGLLVMGMDYAYLALRRTEDGSVALVHARSHDAHEGGEEVGAGEVAVPADTRTLDLRVVVEDGAVCQFSYSIDEAGFETIGAPFQAREGRWIGAKVGLFAVRPPEGQTGGDADFDHLRIEPIDRVP